MINRLVDSVCIERHIVCAVHVINPELFVSLWEVVDADVWGGAGVQPTGWSVPKETRADPAAVAIRHGHVSRNGVDNVADAIGVVFLWAMAKIVSWWWWSSVV